MVTTVSAADESFRLQWPLWGQRIDESGSSIWPGHLSHKAREQKKGKRTKCHRIIAGDRVLPSEAGRASTSLHFKSPHSHPLSQSSYHHASTFKRSDNVSQLRPIYFFPIHHRNRISLRQLATLQACSSNGKRQNRPYRLAELIRSSEAPRSLSFQRGANCRRVRHQCRGHETAGERPACCSRPSGRDPELYMR
jgi:hypothetical protein